MAQHNKIFNELKPKKREKKMKNVTYTAYRFSELSDKAKETAKKSFYENNDYSYLGVDLAESAKCLLEEKNISTIDDVKCFYSFGYSQGDGVCLEGKFLYKGAMIQVRHTGRYYNKNSMEFFIPPELAPDDAEQFKVYLRNVCVDLEAEGYGEIEYRMPDQEFSALSDVNGWYYDETGNLDRRACLS